MKIKLLYIVLCILVFEIKLYAQNDSLKGQEIYSSNFTIDSIPRNIFYYMPVNYGKKEAYPLIIFLHGAGSSAKNMIKTYSDIINAKADAGDCIIMYPDAVSGHWRTKTDTVNDVGFITIMINYFIQVYHADPQRIYIAGFQEGGEMAWRLACDISYRVAAIAAFTGQPANVCNIEETIAVMDTKKFPQQVLQKPDKNAVNESIDFLLMQKKK